MNEKGIFTQKGQLVSPFDKFSLKKKTGSIPVCNFVHCVKAVLYPQCGVQSILPLSVEQL